MKKYRGRDLIIGAILEAAQNGATRTKIMCDAYISYYQCGSYIHELMAAGLMIEENDIYSLSDKGFEALQAQRRFSELIEVPITN